MDEGFDCFFSEYGKKQMHLWLLATHPDYRRRGAGTMLCRWGLDKVNARGWVATVLGSPMGTPLYESLGFRLLGNVVTRIDGEDEQLETSCMLYDNRPINNRKGSLFSTCSCF
jgi:GNAT superfamily N-acetyltransferase